MEMEEKLKEKITNDSLELVAKKAELKNNEREYSFTKKMVIKYKKDLINHDKEVELKKKINIIMLQHFNKIEDKATYTYELVPEYIDLLKEYQIVLNDRQMDDFEIRKEQFTNTLKQEEENIISSEKNIQLLKEEIEGLENGTKQ
jgi:hypothetical protein